MDVLCLMLEWVVVEDLQQRNQIVDTLKSTEFGRKVYDEFMSRQSHLFELVRENNFTLNIGVRNLMGIYYTILTMFNTIYSMIKRELCRQIEVIIIYEY